MQDPQRKAQKITQEKEEKPRRCILFMVYLSSMLRSVFFMQFNLFNPDFYITIHKLIGNKKELFIKHNSTGNYYYYEF